MKCEKIDFKDIPCCNPITINEIYSFKGEKCFNNGKYFGDIIFQDSSGVTKVKYRGKNIYMKGSIFTFTVR